MQPPVSVCTPTLISASCPLLQRLFVLPSFMGEKTLNFLLMTGQLLGQVEVGDN